MANSDKNILITPNTNQSDQPKIEFVGSGSNAITLKVLDDNSLSWEGSEGQLFSITPVLSTGSIFSVNDISGIPSIEVDADGTVSLAEFSGNVGVGTASPTHKLTVNGTVSGSTGLFTSLTASSIQGAIVGNADTATALETARTISATGDVTWSVSFDGSGNASGTAAIGSGVIVNDDINASAAIVDTKLATISTAGKVSNSATTATNANTANAIVARDASGNFSAGTITATLNGNASTATQVSTSLDLSTNASRYIPFVNNLSGINQGLSLDGALVYNPGTNSLTASSFVGDLKGNADTVTNGVTTSNISSYATTAVTAGTGLSGGGTVGALTLNLDFSELTDKTSDIAGTTEFILQDGTTESRKAASEIKLSFFNNDNGWTSNAGTVTSIATNNGITGGTITSAGTVGLTGQALALHNLSTNGLITRTGTGTVAGRTIAGGTGITVTNGDGVSGNPSIALTNNSLTVGSTSISLGGTATTIAGLASVTSTGFTGSLNGNASTATTSVTATTANAVENEITFNNSGTGDASGTTYDGTSEATISYNTVGAPKSDGTGASGTWGISITGNAATVTNGVTTANISSYATTAVTAGTGLSGGGTTGSLTLDLDFSELTDKTSDITGATEFILRDEDGTTESRKAASEIKLSFFNNDNGWTSNTGDITSVVAGNGLTGGATSGDATLTVGAGTGITVNANDVAINTSTVPLLSSANTFTNTQQATLFSGSIGRYDTNAVSLLVPKGTYYSTGGNGSVVIEIPNNTSFMARFRIKFYTYSSDKGSFDVIAGGYYAGSTWYQTSAYIVGDPNKTGLNLPVRFCENTSTSNPTIIIGEQGTSTSWSYFSVVVSEIDANGFSIDSLSTWNGDYAVSVDGALPSATYTTSSTITDCVVGGGDTVSLSANNTWTGQNTFSGYDLTVNDITIGRRNASSNVIIGQYAGNASQTGTNNIFLGRYAASNNSSGGGNVVIGGEAGDITTGTNNVAIGYRSLNGSVTNSYNTGLGAYTLYNLTSGQYNLAMGYNAMGSGVVTGEDNVAAGRNSLYNLTSARYNVGIGYYALFANQTGWNNVAIGYQAGDSITSGGTNTFLGYNAGSSVTTGQYNVILGGYNGTSALSNNIVLSDGQAQVRMLIDSSGFVGINETTPGYRLHVSDSRNLNYVGYFENTSNSGDGIRIYAGETSDTSTKNLIEFRTHGGTLLGGISYTTTTTLTYGTFTGAHESTTVSSSLTEMPYGAIVKVTDSYLSGSDEMGQPIYECALTQTEKEKGVIGVYGGVHTKNNTHNILSLGDGQILVCSEGGNIEIGDYICSSNTEGAGMKQDDDLLHNYTVAKATEAVDWSSEGTTTKLINCTYHCG